MECASEATGGTLSVERCWSWWNFKWTKSYVAQALHLPASTPRIVPHHHISKPAIASRKVLYATLDAFKGHRSSVLYLLVFSTAGLPRIDDSRRDTPRQSARLLPPDLLWSNGRSKHTATFVRNTSRIRIARPKKNRLHTVNIAVATSPH